jgi:alpha-ketoglutarate-dependent taurine dioxygenase
MALVNVDETGTSRNSRWSGPLVMRVDEQTALEEWASSRREWIGEALQEHGALLLRGFSIASVPRFREASEALLVHRLDYIYRSTPRTSMDQGVYTATEYLAHLAIPMHCECAYQRDWPMKLVFGCLQPATTGGETPLARTARVTDRIDPLIVQMFRDRGVLYVRNYGQGVDLPWENVFQTTSRAEVDAYCRREGIDVEWLPDDRLRTRQVCQGVARHPRTGQTLFFNQAHLFHISSVDEETRSSMLDLFDEADLPRNAFFGDGSRIDEPILENIRAAFAAESVAFQWEQGDVLLVDNMLVAHGRRPFTGPRQVLVSMGEPFSSHSSNL